MRWGADAPQRGVAFISYVREDTKRVDRLQAALEANDIQVWRDKRQLRPGEDWKSKIRQAIAADSLAFIACFSNNSESRQATFQRDELVVAIEQLRLRAPDHPYLLPVRFDDCPIPDLIIGGGRTLRDLQWVDLFGRQWQENAERLAESVKDILHETSEPPRGPSRSAKFRAATTPASDDGYRRDHAGWIRRLSRPQLLTAALATLAVVVLAAVAGFWLADKGSAQGLPQAPPGMRVTDNTGAVSVVVPTAWGDVLGDGWHPHVTGVFNGNLIGPGLNAAPNVGAWLNHNLTTPGIFAGASKLLVADHYNPETALSLFGSPCDFSFRRPATADGLTGYREMWDCLHSATRYETVALWPRNHSFIAFIELTIVSPVDVANGNRALASLSVRY